MNKKNLTIVLGVGFFTAFLIYVFSLPLFYLGFFTDDTLFVALAKSILGGEFGLAYSPNPVPVTDPLPGFPLILSPLHLVGGGVLKFKFLSLSLALISGWAFFKVQGKNTTHQIAVISTLLFIMNGVMVRMAGSVLAEIPFLVLTLLGIYFLFQNRSREFWIGCLFLSFSCLVRPQGILFLGSAILSFLFQRQYRKALILGSIGFAPLLLWFIRSSLISSEASGYVTNIARYWDSASHVGSYFHKLKIYLGIAFSGVLFDFPVISSSMLRSCVAWTANILSLGLMTFGFIKNKKNNLLLTGYVYSIGSLLALPLWFGLDRRYVFILLPWFIILGAQGLKELIKINRRYSAVAYAVVALLVLSHGVSIGQTLNDGFAQKKSNPSWPLTPTIDWIKKNLEPGKIFMSGKAPYIFVGSGHQSYPLQSYSGESEFVQDLETKKISYILLSDAAPSGLGKNALPRVVFENIEKWINGDDQFRLIYQSDIDGFRIWKTPVEPG